MLSCDPSVVTQGPGQCEALGLECPSVAECCVNMGRMPSPAETQTPGKGTPSPFFSAFYRGFSKVKLVDTPVSQRELWVS